MTRASQLGQVWAEASYTDQAVYDPQKVGFVQSLTWAPWSPTIPGVSAPGPSVVRGGCDLVNGVPTLLTPGLFAINVWLFHNRTSFSYSLTDGESITGYFTDGEQQFTTQLRNTKLQRLTDRFSKSPVYIRDNNSCFTSVLVNARSAPQTVGGFVRSIGLVAATPIVVHLNIQEILPASGVTAATASTPAGVLNAQDRNKVVTFEP